MERRWIGIGLEVIGGGDLQWYVLRSVRLRSGKTIICRWVGRFCVHERWRRAFLRADLHGLFLLLAT